MEFCLPKNTPSMKDGVNEETEANLRRYGCQLIQEAGILLRLPQQVVLTGQVLLHRFYCRKSFVEFDVKMLAAACILLASKVEEKPTEEKNVLYVFNRLETKIEKLPTEFLDPSSKTYEEVKKELISTEALLLEEIGTISSMEHPHHLIVQYLNFLETRKEVLQEALNLANDSLRTTLCVRFKNEVVACGMVYAAARRKGVPLPESPPWWEVFDVEKSEIDQVCGAMAILYTLPKVEYIPVCKKGASLFKDKSESTVEKPEFDQDMEEGMKGYEDDELEESHAASPTEEANSETKTKNQNGTRHGSRKE